MAEELNPREPFTVDEGVLANMWVMEAIVELLKRKGLCTKQEVHNMVAELRKRYGEVNGKLIVPEPSLQHHRGAVPCRSCVEARRRREARAVRSQRMSEAGRAGDGSDRRGQPVESLAKSLYTMSNPPDNHPASAFPESYLSTEVSDRVIQQILDAFNREGLTSEHARQVLAHVKRLIDLGELIARRTSH